MALVSAIAILFETIPWLRGGFGNIVYFFLYIAIVVVSIMPSQVSGGYRALPEPFGLTAIAADMSRDVKAVYPDYNGGLVIGYTPLRGEIKTFDWDGVAWNASILLMRLLYVAASLLIALLASLLFHRFDPAYESSRLNKSQRKRTAQNTSIEPAAGQLDFSLPLPARPLTPLPAYHSSPLSLFLIQFVAQVKLMVKGLRWWWYLIAAGIILSGLLAADDQTRQIAYLGAWLWPMLLWSEMGTRERQYHTNEIVFSSAHPLSRQLPAAWLAGVFVALVMASGVILHNILSGQWGNLFALVIGALFIPTLAFSLGTLTGSSKLFEVLYLILWYIGPANQLPALDYMGITPEAVNIGIPFYFLVATVVLLSLAIFGRHRQLTS
jgi:hypothetical protein